MIIMVIHPGLGKACVGLPNGRLRSDRLSPDGRVPVPTRGRLLAIQSRWKGLPAGNDTDGQASQSQQLGQLQALGGGACP